MLVSPVTFAIAIISLGFVAMWAFLSFQRRAFRRELEGAVNELRDFTNEQQSRLSKLTPHALDYFNSISSEASHDFGKLNRIIGALKYRVEAVEKLLSAQTDQCFSHAAAIIHSPLTFSDSSFHRVLDEKPLADIPMNQLESEIESLFQILGREIAVASERSEAVKIRCGLKRPTGLSLMEAGIKYVNEQGKRLTGTFKMLVGTEEKNP